MIEKSWGLLICKKLKDGKAKFYQVKQVRDFFITNKIIAGE